MGAEDNFGEADGRTGGGIKRRGLVGSLTKGAVAGTLLAGMASTALAQPTMKKGGAGASAHEQIRNLLAQ